MKRACILLIVLVSSHFLQCPCVAQCVAPELIEGADIYNHLVCQGIQELSEGKSEEALHDFISASEKTTLEYPNTRMFGRIAETYASLQHFKEAQEYLDYDNLSLLWSMGLVRCKSDSAAGHESLFRDGTLLKSEGATHMAGVLCGAIYDNNADFGDRNIDSFESVARAILRHNELQKRVNLMRLRQSVPER